MELGWKTKLKPEQGSREGFPGSRAHITRSSSLLTYVTFSGLITHTEIESQVPVGRKNRAWEMFCTGAVRCRLFLEKVWWKAAQPKIHCADPSARVTRAASRILVALLSISRERKKSSCTNKTKAKHGKVLPIPGVRLFPRNTGFLGKVARERKESCVQTQIQIQTLASDLSSLSLVSLL